MFKRIAEKLRPSRAQYIDRISIEYGGILAQTDCDSILFFLHPDLEWGGELNQAILNMAGSGLDHFVTENVVTPKSGEVFAVPAFEAPFKQMFLAVLDKWDGGIDFEDRDLLNCYRRAIHMAQDAGIKSIAIPAMGRDKRDFPHIRFARLALQGIAESLNGTLERVVIYCVDRRTYDTYCGHVDKMRK